MTEDIAESLGLSSAKGALVAEPQAGSPAAEAGLKSGDVITTLDGAAVNDPRELARHIATLGPDHAVSLGIIRDGHNQTVMVTLGRLQEAGKQASADGSKKSQDQIGELGVTVEPPSAVGRAGKKGVVVTDVDPHGRASDAGLLTGDVLLRAGGGRQIVGRACSRHRGPASDIRALAGARRQICRWPSPLGVLGSTSISDTSARDARLLHTRGSHQVLLIE